ncbi:hypothetical protein, variant 5 [Aphanomyces astaci]|uniref:Uncharacterized protein n=1 Tax=Aphanomyces astaci TaxID=112090 RepID=W4FMK3_APHAT|nr:hypothetical protein, variant 4 [Aphanomyces astaci]XP_009842417.1 hypothetical protein, variant 5 [Aphanomyces astaci]ETV68120.1 hypothetical protein, variant 4 [Aphanomyces astaci]ETV68121.1 hypothetical protein, variant 5 [Aphanomyces astaci]|eukprot:XP_009842416.1 hypothetical protein, variant 4 [Aphanomyces astaci]
MAVESMEAERSRRASLDNIAQVHNQLVRVSTQKKVHNELVRRNSVNDVTEAERTRRMSLDIKAEVHAHLLHRASVEETVELAETERLRRIAVGRFQ